MQFGKLGYFAAAVKSHNFALLDCRITSNSSTALADCRPLA